MAQFWKRHIGADGTVALVLGAVCVSIVLSILYAAGLCFGCDGIPIGPYLASEYGRIILGK